MSTRVVLLKEIERSLERLSLERLRVVKDFLMSLEERESSEATAELLKIPGFEEAFRKALKQVEERQTVRFSEIRREV